MGNNATDPSEAEELVDCLDCEALIAPELDRAYAITPESFLCFDCAVRRGGVYDADEDRWTVAPNTADETDERLGVDELVPAPRPAPPARAP